MGELSVGLKHHLLILAPSLVDELEDFGLANVVASGALDEHEVEQAFFTARGLANWLPEDPDALAPADWEALMVAVHQLRRVLDVIEKETFEAVAREARSVTADRARQDLRAAFEAKRAEGEVDFRLHGLSRTEPKASGQDPAVQEAFRRKRTERHRLLLGFDDDGLSPAESVILADARGLANAVMVDGVTDNRLDALLAMTSVFIEMVSMRRNPGVPDAIRKTFTRMSTKAVMALGAIVYRDEYHRAKQALALSSLPSDL
ncbi:MAG: hypothetical protein R3280_14620 [Marinobacter sp.]|uniref:hypothetical protein n=1 Tax=Marinobacter sp. TaxID=50741 RepID=UPI00299D09E3|nr:hypothetical protein [Marinobacter sp.]MDX1635870.1 hypothetical protein [Marinobacter sp.]